MFFGYNERAIYMRGDLFIIVNVSSSDIDDRHSADFIISYRYKALLKYFYFGDTSYFLDRITGIGRKAIGRSATISNLQND